MNKILLCWWFILIVVSERGLFSDVRWMERKKPESKRIVNLCRKKAALGYPRLTYSDGFLMNQQIWIFFPSARGNESCLWTFNSFGACISTPAIGLDFILLFLLNKKNLISETMMMKGKKSDENRRDSFLLMPQKHCDEAEWMKIFAFMNIFWDIVLEAFVKPCLIPHHSLHNRIS